jgi:DegV family protein with EDD domain
MENYAIYTDSSCDISPQLLQRWDVGCTQLSLSFEGEGKEYACSEIPVGEFYEKMRRGGVAKTAAANIGDFEKAFEPYLQQGQDVLYLGFSSGLSTTYNSACIAAEQLMQKYPGRTILAVDTLAASAGQGLLLQLAVEKKNSGASLGEAAAYIKEMIPKLSHWFTVDDLMYLKRGGRIGAATAVLGTMLNIKPVLHVDDEGHLVNVSKVRGRKAALDTLAKKLG